MGSWNGNTNVIRGPWKHQTRASTRRAAKLASISAVTSADRAFSVAKIDDHHSEGIQSLCHHLVTMPAEVPISDASALRAPNASLGPHSSMTEQNDLISDDMAPALGQFVLKGKAFLSLDGNSALGHIVRMAALDIEEQFKEQFIERVRQARASTGLSQVKIAEALGVPQDRYKWWEQLGEKGRLMPHHLMPRFCTICRVDYVWLGTGHGKMKAAEPVAPEEAPIPAPKVKKTRGKRAA